MVLRLMAGPAGKLGNMHLCFSFYQGISTAHFQGPDPIDDFLRPLDL